MNSKNTYRKANGRRVEGNDLTIRVAQHVNGMLLAQAFVVVRSAGMQLKVNKLDGVACSSSVRSDRDIVYVDVVSGIVRKSWAG